MVLTSRFEEALTFALRTHRNQLRKGTSTPYVEHVLGVASLALLAREVHAAADHGDGNQVDGPGLEPGLEVQAASAGFRFLFFHRSNIKAKKARAASLEAQSPKRV